ncbi:MAG: ABC transporter permease [Candidatus Bathyarchaeia archaeon]
MGLRSFIAKRLIYSFILIIAVIGVNFLIFKAMPGDPTEFLMQAFEKGLGQEERMRQEQLLRERWGFADPLPLQFAKYVRNLLSFNFGTAIIDKRPVSEVMAEKIPYTVLLLGGSTVVSIIVGVLLGILAIQRRGSAFDTGAVLSSLITGALPTFWIGMVFLFIFYTNLGWFPNAGAFPREWAGGHGPKPFGIEYSFQGYAFNIQCLIAFNELFTLVGGYLRHMFLPMLTLVLFNFGGWLLLTRAAMLETITEDYILTARAKGVSETAILIKHALKNASLPIITSAAMAFGFVLSGAIITETVYTYPGVGGWTFFAINTRDLIVLMAIFYVISICVIVANIIADLLYGVLDPRIRYG